MDDLLTSKSNSDEAIVLVKQLIEILATGGHRFTKWMLNSREVKTKLNLSLLAPNFEIDQILNMFGLEVKSLLLICLYVN